MPRRHRESILLNVPFYGHVRQYHNIQAEIDANIHEVAPAASSSWVQQATRRKTAREPSPRRAPQKRRSEVRTMSHKVIFLGQGTTPARRGAARRRTGKDPPARLLLPGGLTQEAAAFCRILFLFGLGSRSNRSVRHRRMTFAELLAVANSMFSRFDSKTKPLKASYCKVPRRSSSSNPSIMSRCLLVL